MRANSRREMRTASLLLTVAMLLSMTSMILALHGTYLLGDNSWHAVYAEMIAQSMRDNHTPFTYSPWWNMGQPMLLYYQPLPELLLATLRILTTLPAATLLKVLVALLWTLTPLCYYAFARAFRFDPVPSAVASLAFTLLQSASNAGAEFGSLALLGLYTQAFGIPLMLLTIASFVSERNARIVGLLLGLTILCHPLYAFIALISCLILALWPHEAYIKDAMARMKTMGLATLVAFAISAWYVLPLLIHHPPTRYPGMPFIDSPSIGSGAINLLLGNYHSPGKWPLLWLAVLAGLVASWRQDRRVLALSTAWFVLFLADPLLTRLPLLSDLHPFRFIGAVQVFSVLGIAALASQIAKEPTRSSRIILAIVLLLLLLPAAGQRLRMASAIDRRYHLEPDYAHEVALIAATLQGTPGRFALKDVPHNLWTANELVLRAKVPYLAGTNAPESSAFIQAHTFNDMSRQDYESDWVEALITGNNVAVPSFLQPIARTEHLILYRYNGTTTPMTGCQVTKDMTNDTCTLVLRMANDPGWRAIVDEKTIRVQQDTAFPTVTIPEQVHQIIFRYRFPKYRPWLLFFGLSALLAFIWRPLQNRKL